jgi:two-component system sensor histidine kinase UhpB
MMNKELQLIFANAPFAISFVDKEMRVIRLNPAIEALVGMKSEEAKGRHCYECWGQYANDNTRQGTEKICDACKVPAALRDGRKYSYEKKVGDKILETITTPVRDLNGEIIGAMEIAIDITERKNTEEKLAHHRELLQQLSSRLIETEEMERRHIARQLHDQIGQQLTALGLNLHILGQNVTPKQRQRIDDSLELIVSMTGQVRDIMADLRPPVLDDYGLRAALRWYSSVFTKRTGVKVIVHAKIPRLSPNLDITLFRITQEALNNVIKHTQATEVEIHGSMEGTTLSLAIHDNGCGIQNINEQEQPSEFHSWGLLSMRERIESFGGKLIIAARPGGGTIITAEVQI